MAKIDELNQTLESLKKQLHDCKLSNQTLTNPDEIKANNKIIEALNVEIKKVKNEIRLEQSIERELSTIGLE